MKIGYRLSNNFSLHVQQSGGRNRQILSHPPLLLPVTQGVHAMKTTNAKQLTTYHNFFVKMTKLQENLGKTWKSSLAIIKKLPPTTTFLQSKSSNIFITFLMEKQNATTVSMYTQVHLQMKYVNKLWSKSTAMSANSFASVLQGTTLSSVMEKNTCDVCTALESLRDSITKFAL